MMRNGIGWCGGVGELGGTCERSGMEVGYSGGVGPARNLGDQNDS